MKNKENMQYIKNVLSKLPVINEITFTKISPEIIINEICNLYGVTFDEIRTKTNKRKFVEPRQIISYFIKKHTKKKKSSYNGKIKDIQITNKEIAIIINKKNHATILHSIRVVENQINTDKNFKMHIDFMDKKIQTYEQTI